MARPNKSQLKKINKFTQKDVTEDQVYVFRSLSADTLPVSRHGWFGEYSINMSSKMLSDLKRSYKEGVGLLASHNKNRLPFGRTYDAEVQVDHVGQDSVETLYIDHYIVTHAKGEDGEVMPLRTEINGMTTQDIVNHIDAGHTFDTSIGFSMSKPTCSICKNDIRDASLCRHLPGAKYEVQDGEKTIEVRCDIIADGGEGIENSLVYAGAVNRAIIQKGEGESTFTATNASELQGNVNSDEVPLYNIEEIKSLSLDADIFCYMTKNSLELYTSSADRKNIEDLRGSGEMPGTKQVAEQVAELKDLVSLTEYNKVVGERDSFTVKLTASEEKVQDLETKLAKAEEDLGLQSALVAELTIKSDLADKFTEDLVNEVVESGVKARGNAFNKERYEKYASTLTVDELREELAAFKAEFPGTIAEARVTAQEVEAEREEETVILSKDAMRQEAAKTAMQRYRLEGGDLEALTKEELSKLEQKSK